MQIFLERINAKKKRDMPLNLPSCNNKILKIFGNRNEGENRRENPYNLLNSFENWWRERDSNPRYLSVHTLSKRAHSATLTSLQDISKK